MTNSIENFIKEKFKNNQSAVENFIKWFSNSKVIDEEGEPLKVYHGTTHDIEEFKHGYAWDESYVGNGFYFTNHIEDASQNYANLEGPDLKSKISFTEDELTDLDIDEYAEKFNMTIEDIEALNNEEFKTLIKNKSKEQHIGDNLGTVLPVYLKMENPLILSGENSTRLDFEVEYEGEVLDIKKPLDETIKIFKFEDYCDVDIIFNEYIMNMICEEYNDYEELIQDMCEHESIQDAIEEIYPDDIEKKTELFQSTFIEKAEDYFNLYEPVEINESPQGPLHDFFEYLENYFVKGTYLESDFRVFQKEIFEVKMNLGIEGFSDCSVTLQDIQKEMEKSQDMMCIELEHNGKSSLFSFGNFINDFALNNGYDGIIMKPVEHFKNMKDVNEETLHYIVFHPNQIKSSIGNNGKFSLDHNEICSRLKDTKENHPCLNLSEIQTVINNHKKNFKQTPKISIIQNEEDLPNKLKKHMKEHNIEMSHLKGYFHRNSIFVFVKNIESKEDLEKTLFHETFHIGFRNMMGNKRNVLLNKTFNYFQEHKMLKEIKKEYDLNFNKVKDRLKAAEEKLAELAENKQKIPFLNNFIGLVRNNIRKIYPQLNINETDIDYIIKSSFNHFDKKEDFKSQYKKEEKKKLVPLKLKT